MFLGLAAASGACLLLLNFAGVGYLSLRAPGVDDYVDFAGTPTLTYAEAKERLRSTAVHPTVDSLSAVTRVFHEAMVHIDPTDREIVGLKELRMTIPIWENYVLYALSYLKPDTYRDYEFCSYRRALERGVGRCGQQSLALVDFLSAKGIKTGFVYLGGHTLVTAQVDSGRWVMLDPDYGAAIPFDLAQAEAQPETVIPYYWNNQVVSRNLFRSFAPAKNKIRYGGPDVRWGRVCVIEKIAYILKWLLPLLLLLPGFAFWANLRLRRF